MRCVLLLAVALGLGFGRKAPRPRPEPQPQDQARGAQEVLAALEQRLEQAPDDRDLLDAASLAAEEANELDVALWYATLLLDQLGDTKPEQERAKLLQARIASLDLVSAQNGDVVRSCAELAGQRLELGRGCALRRLYVNAVDFFLACKGTRYADRAEAELEKLYAKEDAATAILQSGMDLPERPMTKEKARRIAASDARHGTWATAYKKESAGYEITTNMGWALRDEIATAMDEMNRFYRKVFQPKGSLKKVKILAYGSRDDFDRNEHGIPPTVRGFFVPSELRIATYDSRSEGRPLAAFWSTLFHEASHQFTHEISKGIVPGWLNEGTASYFEGARLLPNGSVETNLIPRGRITELVAIFKRGKPDLESVVSYHNPGSYDGSYYPVGWALVYFCHNYEDEKCERPYLASYRSFLDSWRRTQDKSRAYDRFVEHFVTRPKRPGIATFADFEKLWKEWMVALQETYFGDADRADGLLAKARKQVQFKKIDAAVESYRFALLKRPTDLAALYELALLQLKLGQKDSAVINLRRAFERARLVEPDAPVPNLTVTHGDCVKQCLKEITQIDRWLGESLDKATQGFAASAATAANTYWTGGFPRRALMIVEDAIELLRGDRTLETLRDQIHEKSGVELARWRTLAIAPGLEGWEGNGCFQEAAGTLQAQKGRLGWLFRREPLPSHYVVEATIERPDGEGTAFGFCGVIFGESEETGVRSLAIGLLDMVVTMELDEEKGFDLSDAMGAAPKGPARLRVDVLAPRGATEGKATFFVGDKEVGSETLDLRSFRPLVGACAFASASKVTGLRVRQ